MDLNVRSAKSAAKILRTELSSDRTPVTQSRALEIVARQLGFSDWNTASAKLASASGSAIPVLRVQDEHLARQFYLDYLGFSVEWEHRFDDELPLYARITRSGTTVDLSEHHGDGTTGSVVWIPVTDLPALHHELTQKSHKKIRPGIERDAPGGPTMTIIDPFANELRFCQPQQA